MVVRRDGVINNETPCDFIKAHFTVSSQLVACDAWVGIEVADKWRIKWVTVVRIRVEETRKSRTRRYGFLVVIVANTRCHLKAIRHVEVAFSEHAEALKLEATCVVTEIGGTQI